MNDLHFGTKFVYVNLKYMCKISVNPFAQFLFSLSIYKLFIFLFIYFFFHLLLLDLQGNVVIIKSF